MPFLGEISALLTACFWSGSSIAFAAATHRVGSVQVNLTRLSLAALILISVTLAARLRVDLSASQVLYLGVSGVIGFVVGDTTLFEAFRRLGPRISMLIMSLAPAVAAALAYVMLGEGLSLAGFAGIALTIAGICIVIMERKDPDEGGNRGQHHVTSAGIILALIAASGQGAGLVFAKMAFREGSVNGFVATLVRIVASLVVLFPAIVIARKFTNPIETFRRDTRAFALTVAGSVLGPVLGVVGSLISIQFTKVGIAATLMATTPIIMLPLLRVTHKEPLGWRALAGSITAVGGVAALFLR